MKKIDAIITKLEKVPSAVWIILVGLSYTFATFYSLMTTSEQAIATLNEMMAQVAVEFTGFMSNMAWLFYIEAAIMGIIIFELILLLVYRFMYNRRFINGNMLHFKTAARLSYIAANIIVGLFSLISFGVPVFQIYNQYIISFVAYTGAFVVAYLAVKESVINPRLKGTALMKLFTFYYSVEVVLNSFYFIMLFTVPERNIHEIIACGVTLAIIAVSAFILHRYVIKPLIRQEKDHIEIIYKDPNDNPPPDEIFRGYGF